MLKYILIFLDYVEPATTAPFHIENDELQMINNDERLAVSFLATFTFVLSCVQNRHFCEQTSALAHARTS